MLVIPCGIFAEEPTPSTYVDGTATQNSNWNHGIPTTFGGYSSGGSAGSFKANGPCASTNSCDPDGSHGVASALGVYTGENSGAGTNTGFSLSRGTVSSNANAFGVTLSEIKFNGLVNQLNTASLNSGSGNLVSGWNYTDGNFTGSNSGAPSKEGSGNSESLGRTDVALTETPDVSKSAYVNSTGNSFANSFPGIGGTAETGVSGEGKIGANTTMGGAPGQNFLANAGFIGSAGFLGLGTQDVNGRLNMNGSTELRVDAKSVISFAITGSLANVSNSTCSSGCE